MIRVRRALGRIAFGWLIIEAALLAAAPASLSLLADAHSIQCTCATDGDHAICPLHHPASADSKLCLMRSAEEPGTTILSSVFGWLGFVTGSAEPVVPAAGQSLVLDDDTASSLRPARPDSPPPRV
jgi:hypothetical protein